MKYDSNELARNIDDIIERIGYLKETPAEATEEERERRQHVIKGLQHRLNVLLGYMTTNAWRVRIWKRNRKGQSTRLLLVRTIACPYYQQAVDRGYQIARDEGLGKTIVDATRLTVGK